VLRKSFEEKRLRIGFRPDDDTFEVADAAIPRDPEFIPDITALWAEGWRATVQRQRPERVLARDVGQRCLPSASSGRATCTRCPSGGSSSTAPRSWSGDDPSSPASSAKASLPCGETPRCPRTDPCRT
jgi:hypothetical protein